MVTCFKANPSQKLRHVSLLSVVVVVVVVVVFNCWTYLPVSVFLIASPDKNKGS